jgi:hypothetical protein
MTPRQRVSAMDGRRAVVDRPRRWLVVQRAKLARPHGAVESLAPHFRSER